MMTGEIRSKIDAVWNAFWAGGIANPLEVMDVLQRVQAAASAG
jgi:type I restriction enzyme M protein